MSYNAPSHSVSQEATSEKISAPDAQASNWADRKLTSTQRADLAFRYLDWLLTKKIPSGGFRLLYAITQRFTEENPHHCFPSIEYLAARIGRSESAVWEMLPKLAKIGAIEIEWGSRGSKHPNTYTLPAAFLEFYFGPEKGRQPRPAKPRRAGVSKAPKTPVQPTENPGLPDGKPRPAGVNHLVATYKQPRAGLYGPRSSGVEIQSPANGNKSPDDAALNPASNIDIPDTPSAPVRRLCSDRVEKDQAETHSLQAPCCPIRAVANGANAHHDHRNGQAARRPDTEPHHQGTCTMPRIARIQSREEMFAKIKRVYPPKFLGNDDALNFEALGIALDHGTEFTELMYEASQLPIEPIDGVEVPLLVEFLASKCWSESIAA
jgi:hypothetical protein